jgi:hypothetical protein
MALNKSHNVVIAERVADHQQCSARQLLLELPCFVQCRLSEAIKPILQFLRILD